MPSVLSLHALPFQFDLQQFYGRTSRICDDDAGTEVLLFVNYLTVRTSRP